MEKYSIKELQNRYGLKTRQSVYDRVKAVDVVLLKEGNKSYVTEDAITILDQLQEHLNLGGSIKTFTPTVKTRLHSPIDSVNSQLDSLTVNSQIDSVNTQLDTKEKYVQLELFEITIEEVVKKVVEKVVPSNPINHWEKLDQARERGYILTSKEVAQLLGTKPKGKEWIRGAFKFIRFGKIGNQSAWKVYKIT